MEKPSLVMAIGKLAIASDTGLVALSLKCSSVATTRVLLVGTRLAALIGPQQMTLAVGATTRVSRINRWTPRVQCHRLGESAVVLQGAKLGVDVVEVARTVETATVVAA